MAERKGFEPSFSTGETARNLAGVADRMIERYKGIASRLVIYLASHWREVDPKILERWAKWRAVGKAG
jgi:hypothetical protein